jgi:hypothetical protein
MTALEPLIVPPGLMQGAWQDYETVVPLYVDLGVAPPLAASEVMQRANENQVVATGVAAGTGRDGVRNGDPEAAAEKPLVSRGRTISSAELQLQPVAEKACSTKS